MIMPYAVWASADCSSNSAYMSDIGLASLCGNGQSEAANIKRACNSKKISTATSTATMEIMNMFKEEDTVEVLYNQELNRRLRDLVNIVTSSLAKASKEVAEFTNIVFERQ